MLQDTITERRTQSLADPGTLTFLNMKKCVTCIEVVTTLSMSVPQALVYVPLFNAHL